MLHPIIQHPLHQKDDHEPVDGDESQWEIEAKQPDNGYTDGEGDLTSKIEYGEQVINDLQIYVL